ncbi:2OG-Fe(II) oxygenase [Croceicoccus bisphenolivorans]|uniref:2OG-Fe(II) oxygenase n=1 Tax=Croceicoccus bisphenolivorans TaxID=1783232 RepID=UPI00083467ED|nr:2OG-Fe(II) oxygenase [Croceicoccus bisphenolivorans]
MIVPGTVIRDSFLPAGLHGELLEYALSQEDRFRPASTAGVDDGVAEEGYRCALVHRDGLGPIKDRFRACVAAVLPEISATLGTPPPERPLFEMELVAHRDGAFYKRHIDTHTQGTASRREGVRILSLVYYFHRQPRHFTGGELAIFAFGPNPDPVRLVEARDNRLTCFSSIAVHEVMPVSVAGNAFADARFAVNCWINRAKPASA